MRCPTCNEDTRFKSRGGWLNYANGIGSPEGTCPNCKDKMPTGRRFWNELTQSYKFMVYSKGLFWVPVGMLFFSVMGYLYSTTRNSNTGAEAVMTDEEAMVFFADNYPFVLSFALVASLAANLTTLKLVIRSNTVKTRGWE